MEDFWKSVQTIQAERGADYRAFSLFSATHWAELLGAAAVIFLCAVIYYRCREVTRHQILRAVFVLMLADEFMKQTVLLYTGQWNVTYLPLHLCSMVLGMAGNVGTQSLAVTIRVLVDENLTVSKKFQLLWKEVRVGLLNGTILAVMALSFLGCYIHFFKGYAWNTALLLSGCVGASLVVAMVVSSLVGTLVPMLFHKIHIDPAVASGPLITTINDLVAVVVYYGLAMVVLIDLFHLA